MRRPGRRQRHEEEENADRWVISYADFITLLFAFFTTMYAISHVDAGKLERFTGSLKSAFKASGRDAVQTPVIDGIHPANYADIGLESDAKAALARFAIIEGITVLRDQRGVIVSLGDSLLFESGAAVLRSEAQPVLAAVAGLITSSRRAVIVEGHTDNLPLTGRRYASNGELSAARAAAVLAVLGDFSGISPDRVTLAGYGEYRPVASNATPEGRARNRRVDIILASRAD